MSADRDYYEVLGVPQRRRRGGDQVGASASSPMKLHPDQKPGLQSLRGEVQGDRRSLFACSPIRRSARVRPLRQSRLPRRGRRRRPRFRPRRCGCSDFSDLFNEIFGGGFEDVFAPPAAAGRATAPNAAPICATMSRSRSSKRSVACEREIVVPRAQACEPCSGSGLAKANAPLETCRTCNGQGQVRAKQGMFRMVRTCPGLPRARPSNQNTVQVLRRPRPDAEGADALGENPRRRRRRHAHPPRRRRRWRRSRRPARRSLSLPLGEAARAVRARRAGPLLPRADANV